MLRKSCAKGTFTCVMASLPLLVQLIVSHRRLESTRRGTRAGGLAWSVVRLNVRGWKSGGGNADMCGVGNGYFILFSRAPRRFSTSMLTPRPRFVDFLHSNKQQSTKKLLAYLLREEVNTNCRDHPPPIPGNNRCRRDTTRHHTILNTAILSCKSRPALHATHLPHSLQDTLTLRRQSSRSAVIFVRRPVLDSAVHGVKVVDAAVGPPPFFPLRG